MALSRLPNFLDPVLATHAGFLCFAFYCGQTQRDGKLLPCEVLGPHPSSVHAIGRMANRKALLHTLFDCWDFAVDIVEIQDDIAKPDRPIILLTDGNTCYCAILRNGLILRS